MRGRASTYLRIEVVVLILFDQKSGGSPLAIFTEQECRYVADRLSNATSEELQARRYREPFPGAHHR